LNLTLGFDLETFQIPLEELMPSKKVPDSVMTTRKFKQIVSSIREIGLIEPLSVIKPDPDAAAFFSCWMAICGPWRSRNWDRTLRPA